MIGETSDLEPAIRERCLTALPFSDHMADH